MNYYYRYHFYVIQGGNILFTGLDAQGHSVWGKRIN